ncbi:MAG: energy transducer TonB [Paludibacteraceae bacterium]|nr:energy transducer TonB [Paludibacteraceae bacterium]MBQ2520285.1 energy transducer TonB [Paludibacteraceae bacterium]MBQ4018145.1 energy transducer TonB [Paludibacteraceae bacterium]MBQ5378929.1 energy transducer TonB [Paludibacteraceae bacterium]
MKKLFLLMVAAVLSTGWAAAQNTAEQSEEEMVFLVVDEMPAFPGGQEALFKYLTDNVIYPQIAKENGIEGRVICTFVIEPDGSISNVEVVRSGGDPSLDKEAVRVIKSMPKWKPGKQRGQAVRVKFTIPVKFSLAKETQKDK